MKTSIRESRGRRVRLGAIVWILLRSVALAAAAAGDVYEPDDSASGAKALANGRTQSRSLHAAGNADWAKFTVGICGARNATVETAGASGDTQVWLYRGGGALVAYDDNSGAGNFSKIAAAALAPGTYFVRVVEYGNNGTIPAYTLKASWQDGDAWEADDTAAAAKAIANGRTQSRSIHAANDMDWARFTVGAAGARNVVVETSGARGDTLLWLYGPNSFSTPAARDDDSGAGYFSRIALAALRPGTYFIQVRSYQSCGGSGVIPAYTLRASWTSP